MATKKNRTETELHPLADLYTRWVLNPLVEIAYALSHDVAVRPQNYREVDGDTLRIMSDFRFNTGVDPEWPNAFQRTLSFKSLCEVQLASPPVRAAALQAQRGAAGKSEDPELASFKDAADAFRAQLRPLEGQGLWMLCAETRPIFKKAVTLFRTPEIAAAFGSAPAPGDPWPIGRNFDGKAAYLVAQITRGLNAAACLTGFFRRLDAQTPEPRRLVPRYMVKLSPGKFIKLQQAAYWGSLTIHHLLQGDAGETEARMMDYARNWARALQELVPDSARAWKDLDYRATLTDVEWGTSPNPAGIPLNVIVGAAGGQTYTQVGEICCCSGDLDCDPTTQLTDFCSEYQCGSLAFEGCGGGVLVRTDA